MKGLGCFIIAFSGMLGAIALMPIAILTICTGDLRTIALVVYFEMGVFCLIGGIVLAFLQHDSAYGIATGVAVAAAICIAVYLSYNLPAHSDYDLRGNSFYTHYIGIPLSLASCWAGYLVTHFIRRRRLGRMGG